MNWDWLISITIILFLILLIWSRIEKKTIVELVEEIMDFFQDKSEEAQEKTGVEVFQ